MTYLDRVAGALADIHAKGQYREIPERQFFGVVDFSSNDYLGLASDPQVVEALKHATRVGSGGARLLGGRHREPSLLEEELAGWLGRERALLFSSGYLAGAGTIPVLAELVETILSDRANHASLIDGIRLARRPHEIYAHRRVPATNGADAALVVSESIFSMEGDAADPAALIESLHAGDILLLDEAHAIGVAGPQGAGLARSVGDPRIVVLGTLSKALGALGGFVAGPGAVIELLVNRARTFIFDTALPPALVLAARVALALARRGDDRRARLYANVACLREALPALGVPLPPTAPQSPIVPIPIGSEERALHVTQRLLERRIFVPAIRPPTVPPGTSRLRVSLRADHTIEHVDMLAAELARCIATS